MSDISIQNSPIEGLSATKQKALNRANSPKKVFTGKTSNFEDNRERHFYQRMLKAYLAGKPMFNFGFEDVKTEFGAIVRQPKRYLVEVSDQTLNKDAVETLLANGYCDPGLQTESVKVAKRKSHAQIKDILFNRSEDEREKRVTIINKNIAVYNKGTKKEEKKPLLVFKRGTRKPVVKD